MKTLYILRHAKSDRDVPVKDEERPLNARGRAAAPRMGDYMRAKRYRPDLVLCSTARRTVETYDLVRPSLGDVPVMFEGGLYLAEVRELVDRLRWVEDDAESVMLIGHNPGLEELANAITRSPETEKEEKIHRRMREKFSTAALAVIKLPIKAWRDLKPRTGTLVDFMRPKDL